MGLLVDGKWHDVWYDTAASKGKFQRETAQFRNWITPDGRPGASGSGGFAAEAGRYHLYVSLACPWAHRTMIFRNLKGLEDIVDVTVVDPLMLENGWEFMRAPGQGDPLHGQEFLHQVYTRAVADYSGRVTVPVLWDRQRDTIVSNESSEIIRMMNSAFDDLGANSADFYPPDLRDAIDDLNLRIYATVNNGVYRAGFATTQAAYDEAFDALFATLAELDTRLADSRYLLGGRLTEADLRLFTTLVRFDAVYHGHFKTNLKRIEDYAHLPGYLRDIYQIKGIAETVDFDHIKRHYYISQRSVNPTGIVPKGPQIDYATPHGRARLGGTR